MPRNPETQLADFGKRLGTPSQPKDALLKLLKQAATLLAEVEQSPPQSTVDAMKGCTDALVLPTLLKHKDKDVRLLVATCISEIMRIVAPHAPYSDDTLKEIFHLIVAIFRGLDDVHSPSFARRVNILETVGNVRSCLVMLDLECDELILEMFHTFFATASDEHPQNVFTAMENVLTLVLTESEDIPVPMMEVVLKHLLKQNKEVSAAAHKLAVAVVENCADKLGPYVQHFLTSVMLEGRASESGLHKDYHEIIYEIYQCAPQMLLTVIPNLTQELVMDKRDVRLKAVELLGRLFALPGQHVVQEYPQLFSEFLRRFSDKASEVRTAVVSCVKKCLEANPNGSGAREILAGLEERLLDYDDKLRMTAVKAICDLSITNPNCVPVEILHQVAARLRDKKVFVRKDTLQKLIEVYRTYCTRCFKGSIAPDKQFEWIPSKLVRCCYDRDVKEFKPQGMEIVFTEELFPVDLPVEEQAKHWIAIFSTFDENDVKAFQQILFQKQRLQLEMQVYVSLREKAKEEDVPELLKKFESSFKIIANEFVDPIKAEENLQELHQMKDNNIFKALLTLLNSNPAPAEARITQEELLKRIGNKHPQYDFMKVLATKCAFVLFNKEHVRVILKMISLYKESGSIDLVAASLSLLVELAGYSPVLMEGTEDGLMKLLKDTDESIKEGVVHILSKAGGSLREQIGNGDAGSFVDLTLERLCLEGTRKQAKYAVSAIAAITADSGLKALSVLYGRLLDVLEDSAHLPTILQSLGCIAQNAIPVFETREDDIIKFVVRDVLRRPHVPPGEEEKPDWRSPNEIVHIKICALKMLVKSFLPNSNAHQRKGLPGLLKVLVQLLAMGEIADDVKASNMEKAHLRLASVKAVLRLARKWDLQIPPDVVQMTLMTIQDSEVHVRRQFLLKLHQYLKDRSLHQKYASALVLSAVDPVNDNFAEARRYLAEYIESSRKEVRKSIAGQIEATSITQHPEYVLTYLVHVLAHHLSFPSTSGDTAPDASAYEPFYRMLFFILEALVHPERDGHSEAGNNEDTDELASILAIFRTIKKSEDAVDKARTNNVCAVCDMGIMISKDIVRKKLSMGEYPGVIPLPVMYYKVPEGVEGSEDTAVQVDGSHLPSCLTDSDVLARFKSGTSRGQPSSPQGQKRSKRHMDGEDADKGENNEPNNKRSRHDPEREKSAVGTEKSTSKGSRGWNKFRDKNEHVKPGNKIRNSDTKGDGEFDKEKQEETPPTKRKRGRPKGSGTKGEKESPDATELAGPTPDKSRMSTAKTGMTAADNQRLLLNSVPKKPGRPAKVKPLVLSEGYRQNGGSPSKHKESVEAIQSPLGTPAKALKKANLLAVEKSPAWKNEDDRGADESLVGCRIKVWWPLDQRVENRRFIREKITKRFYLGEIVAYDSKKKKHQVLYDDGEREKLNLVKERWESVSKNKVPRKAVSTTPATPTASPSDIVENKKRMAGSKASATQDDMPGPSDESKGPSSAKAGKEGASHGTGKGATPVKSAAASAKSTASPFEYSDEDFDLPTVDKGGGKQGQSSLSQRGSNGKVSKVRIGRDLRKPHVADWVNDGPIHSADQPSKARSTSPVAATKEDDDEPLDTWRSRKRKVR